MKSLKNSFNIHPHKKTSDKEFNQLLCALEERYEFCCLTRVWKKLWRGQGCSGLCFCHGTMTMDIDALYWVGGQADALQLLGILEEQK